MEKNPLKSGHNNTEKRFSLKDAFKSFTPFLHRDNQHNMANLFCKSAFCHFYRIQSAIQFSIR